MMSRFRVRRGRVCKLTVVLVVVLHVYLFMSLWFLSSNKKTVIPVTALESYVLNLKCPFDETDYVDMDSILPVYQPCNGMNIFGNYFIHFVNLILNPFQGKYSMEQLKLLRIMNPTPFSCHVSCEDFAGFDDEQNELLVIQDWMNRTLLTDEYDFHNKSEPMLTVAIERPGLSNLYTRMNAHYMTYLIGSHFQRYIKCELEVLLADNWLLPDDDITWRVLYKNVKKVSTLTSVVKYKHVTWVMPTASPLGKEKFIEESYIDSFSSFVLQNHGIFRETDNKCEKISILFLNTNPEVHHNKRGDERENGIKNIDELIEEVKKLSSVFDVKSVTVDNLSFKKQLEYVSKTSILIGMHGPKMTNIIFLSKDAAVIELFPLGIPIINRRYKLLATSRGIVYRHFQITRNWENPDEPFTSYVQPKVLLTLVKQTINKLCKRRQ